MSSRIYYVHVRDTDQYLVRASSKYAALRHVAEKLMTVEIASQDQLVDLIGKVDVEEAD